ncbi:MULTISPECIES: LUD domain-containing protein [Commensalibacter]|uniref:LutC/YkgG family protein n=1 Tax=Commensalibacter TaxID=1079922 RepID=UPI0012D87925|nr:MULTISPECIES: LUD domain-containing protein [Commensalibacter]MCT6851651.1 LUD domain-containing protein [Commensalibacter sp.]MBH9969324.1 LUD domain-containing protein [Commensalibacter sp. M0265]MBH9976679.1 LUD domain-containing protein [Commensalibacter sp. M0266]MBH9992384.1 LUD domain-containing protein [Commensalibacter sp. M0270]MBI0045855.1 LUD domain-containing protein [Commensalibacter sp. M0267]
MNSRDIILGKIRKACVDEYVKPPSVPLFHQNDLDLIKKFKKVFEQMGGELLENHADNPFESIYEKLSNAKNICSVVKEIKGDYNITDQTPPNSLHDIDYAVVRASFGVAETGSVCLTEKDLVVNTLGYLPQHLVVLLNSSEIVENLHDAYARPEWRRNHYAALHTGPSATADIEGVLIHGAQGVRSLSLLLL